MHKLVARAYNSFEVDEVNGIIKKMSSTPRLQDEINYYIRLSKFHPRESVLFPRLLDYMSTGNSNYWMELELYSYPNLGSYLLGERTIDSWSNLFSRLNDILSEWSSVYPYEGMFQQEELPAYTQDMYIDKTEREFRNFVDGWSDKFPNMFSSESLEINGTIYKNFSVIWKEIRAYIQQHMLSYTPTLIHGDCCFSNILYGQEKNIIRFIDPRGSFGKKGVYGDIRYDVAKLYHSVDGLYEAYITDNFTVRNVEKNRHILITSELISSDIKSQFESVFFPKYSKKEIKILQGCIFIGMCARHYDSLTRQHAMYLTGVRLLNEALKL